MKQRLARAKTNDPFWSITTVNFAGKKYRCYWNMETLVYLQEGSNLYDLSQGMDFVFTVDAETAMMILSNDRLKRKIKAVAGGAHRIEVRHPDGYWEWV